MEYCSTVTKRTNVNFKFADGVNLEELAKEFSECIYQVDDAEELIEFITKQLSNEPSFIEGIGKVEYSISLSFEYADEDTVLVYNTEVFDFEVEYN